MTDLDERHGVDDPATGHRRVRPRPPRARAPHQTASAAVLVLVVTLATGTLGTGSLGEPPARTRLVGTVVRASSVPTTPLAESTGVWPPLTGGASVGPGGAAIAVPAVPGVGVPGVASPPAAAQPAPVEERPAPFTTGLPDQRAAVAIRTAMAQIGLPYVWGGDGPTNGDAGFDCSGLTTFAYAAAGIGLPRTAHTQYYGGLHVPPNDTLQPGDLVFYGTPAFVHHVGLYIGDGKMVNAPTFGRPVQVAFVRWSGDDYLGATRPAATGSTTGLLPYAPPAPVSPAQPREFPAPTAPAPAPGSQAQLAQAAVQTTTVTATAEPTSSSSAATTTSSKPPKTSTTTTTTTTPKTSATSKPPKTTTTSTVTKTATAKPDSTKTSSPPATEEESSGSTNRSSGSTDAPDS